MSTNRKIYNKKLSLLITALTFSVSSSVYSSINNFEPISSFSQLELFKNGENGSAYIDSAEFTLNHRYTELNLYQQESGKLAFNGTMFSEDLKSYYAVNSKLDDLDLNFGEGFNNPEDLQLYVASTKTNVYVSIFNRKCQWSSSYLQTDGNSEQKTCYSHLIQTSDGINWNKVRTFDNNHKVWYIYGTDNQLYINQNTDQQQSVVSILNPDTNSLDEVALPNNTNEDDANKVYLSSTAISNDKLFVITSNISGQKNYYIKDLSDPSYNWSNVNLPRIVTKNISGKDLNFEFNTLFWIKKIGDYHLAEAFYTRKDILDPPGSQDIYLISKDGGLNWTEIKLDLSGQFVFDIIKKDGKYQFITENDFSDYDSDSDNDSNNNLSDEQHVELAKQDLAKSSIRSYALSEEQLFSTESLKLEPSYVYNHHASFNKLPDRNVVRFAYLENEVPMFGFFKYQG